MRTIPSVLEHIFTNANPVSGHPAPPHTAWVIFAGGTVFYTFPSDDLPFDATADQLAAAANRALDELGPATAGTPSADFGVSPLHSWFPDELVYFVTYDHPAIATIVIDQTEREDLQVGLEGRARREQDFTERKIALIRTFSGS